MNDQPYLRCAAILLPLLGGCQTTVDRSTRLQSHIGRTMADFSRDTGLVPADMYNTADGRVFVLNGPAIGVAVAPRIVVSGGCRLLIETIAASARSTADAWQITAITANGPC
ncbi:hypothetical protein ACVWZL_001309 [Bradyrhizobium sp. GM2.4]